VLQSGQTVATIAPDGARLVVEAQLLNKDIAFIEKGLPAKLKFDAFPFQNYGVVEGTVIDVSPDAQVDKEFGSFYKVTIAPKTTGIIAKGKTVPLRPGLAVSAEIVTDRKSILVCYLNRFGNSRETSRSESPVRSSSMTSLSEYIGLEVNGEAISLKEVLRFAKWPTLAAFLQEAADAALIRHAAVEHGIEASNEELQQAADGFRAERDLYTPEATEEWLATNHLSYTEWEAFFENEIIRRKLRDADWWLHRKILC
jgi:hypothetical protein